MIVTRFAPSPTGLLHVGGVRTALFSWLHARRHGGKFILRIEDTDRERSTDAAVEVILEGMRWLGLDADEGPFFQSARFERYRDVVDLLIKNGDAYRCYCTRGELEKMRVDQIARKEKPRYNGRCRDRTDVPEGVQPVIRFRNPIDGEVTVEDLVHGRVVFQNRELDDLVIARSDGTPTYNFCVVVDDMDMGVTHVIRGDDHLNNTPRQMNMLRALKAAIPTYAHVPMILGADGAKLSKRHGAVSVLQFEEEGYLPDALLNYLVRLGWSHGDQEIFSRQEMIANFDITDVNKAASAFNPDKLLWLNQQHLMRMDPSSVITYLRPHLMRLGIVCDDDQFLGQLVIALRERVKTLRELALRSQCFFGDEAVIEPSAAAKHLSGDAKTLLRELIPELAGLEAWLPATINATLTAFALGRSLALGKVAQPLRVAVTGSTISPPIDTTLALLGRERALRRLALASSP